jgi:hypothetical protein
MYDANHNPADFGENLGRGNVGQLICSSHHTHEMVTAIACEVLARRIVHVSPPDRLAVIMSTRFRHREADGDESELSSALEVAIDSNW